MGCKSKVREVLGEELSEDDICKIAVLAVKALKPVLDRVRLPLKGLDYFEIDPEGPRVIVKLVKPVEPIAEAYIDMSPDGVEFSLELTLEPGLEKDKLETALADKIEESGEFMGVQEYDLSYDPQTGTLTMLFTSNLVTELPSINVIREIVSNIVSQLQSRG
ncbi:MAG TPA: hypothetical protein EYH08_06230 [Pyrodictium sp.]|nr:hypothetical protein [Pyrodictium sp.]